MITQRNLKLDQHDLTLAVLLNPRRFRLAMVALFGVAVFLAFGTWTNGIYLDRYLLPWNEWTNFHKLMLQADLGRENNVAVWFSSMLLLVIAMLCLLCFVAEPRGQVKFQFQFGWLIAAFIFSILSLDELGSFHERLAIWNPSSGWIILLAPFIIMVPGYMLFFAWIQARRSRAGFLYTILGVTIFSSVPIFEFFETRAFNGVGQVLRDTQVLWRTLEEFCELLGMLAFIIAIFSFAQSIARLQVSEQPKEHTVILHRTTAGRILALGLSTVLVGIVGVFASRHYLAPLKVDGADGIAENWFPSGLLFCTALLLSQLVGCGRARFSRQALVVAVVIVSIYIGGNLQNFFYGGNNADLMKGIIVVLASPMLLAVSLEATINAKILGFAAAMPPLATVLVGPGALVTPAGVAAAGLLLGYAGFLLSEAGHRTLGPHAESMQ